MMLQYILQRLMHALGVLIGVSVVVFLLIHLSGDPVSTLLPLNTPKEDVELFRRQMGFDRPIPIQYLRFISRTLQGDFGYSYRHRTQALPLVLERLPATLRLTGVAFLFSLLVAVPLGIVAAYKKDSLLDAAARASALLGQAVPGFWLATLLILIFAVWLRWFPVSGSRGWKSLILPGITVGSFFMATITRLLRSSLLEVMAEAYIRTARGKGLTPARVLTAHALKNAAIPVVTAIGLQVSVLLGGSLIAETIFAYPGMGRLAVQSITARDLPVIQAYVAVIATITVLLNLTVDFAYAWLDPRVRLWEKQV